MQRGSTYFVYHVRCNRMLSSNQEGEDAPVSEVKNKSRFGSMLQQRTEKLRQTEERLKATGQNLLKDIQEAKEKMKERMEEVIEVSQNMFSFFL